MHIKGRFHNTIFGPSWSPLNAALALMLALLFLILLLVLMNLTAQPAQGQTCGGPYQCYDINGAGCGVLYEITR